MTDPDDYSYAKNPEKYLKEDVTSRDYVAGFINRVFGWMFLGLGVTGGIAYALCAHDPWANFLMESPDFIWVPLIATFVLVWIISANVLRFKPIVSMGLFLLYAAIEGVLFSALLPYYDSSAISMAFLTTAGMFGATCIFGYLTRMNLTSLRGFLFMALIGLIIASIVNIFWANDTLYWIVTYAGILIFVGLTAYDTQKMKQIAEGLGEDGVETDAGKGIAISGALALYLDFINLFLLLLRFFGRRD